MVDLSPTCVKSPSCHNRSKSSPQSQGSSSIVNPQWYASHGVPDKVLAPSAAGDPYPSSRPLQSCDGDGLAAPDQTHRRSFTPERGRSIRRELPPLVTRICEREHNLQLDPSHTSLQDLNHLQPDPPQSRQSSPTKVGGKLADWFRGESDPITFSILPSPTKDKLDPLDSMPTSSANRTSLARKNSAQAMPKPALSSRFSFFTAKAPSPTTSPQSSELNDDFLDLDVHKALFPAGPADPFSPAAFKNLVQNAEGLLSRLQMAYKERTQSLREMTIEKETQAEELEGAVTRAKHLKLQLDDMAVKLAEQDDAMMNLVDDLAREKQLRREEEDARKRSVVLLRASREAHAERSQRESRSSINSDWSCESEAESSVDSVFSHRHGATSPTMSTSSVSTTNSPDIHQLFDLGSVAPFTEAARHRPGLNPQPIVKAMAGSKCQNETISWQDYQGLKCANCHGLTTNEAWNVVGILKVENKGLKGRVEQMEGALDGCLGMVEMLR